MVAAGLEAKLESLFPSFSAHLDRYFASSSTSSPVLGDKPALEEIMAAQIYDALQRGALQENKLTESSLDARLKGTFEVNELTGVEVVVDGRRDRDFSIHGSEHVATTLNFYLRYLANQGKVVQILKLNHIPLDANLIVPETVEHLTFVGCPYLRLDRSFKLPSQLKILGVWGVDINGSANLPASLKRLDITTGFLSHHSDLAGLRLPSGLEYCSLPEEGFKKIKQTGYVPPRLQADCLERELDELFGRSNDSRTNEVTLTRSPTNYDDILQKLSNAGIPEAVLDQRNGIAAYLAQASKTGIISTNPVFYVLDKYKQKWVLKISTNQAKARVESAANYYLGPVMKFIPQGKFPEPLEADGLYVTMQKDITDLVTGAKSVDYWLSCFALFHRDAARILRENGVQLPRALPLVAAVEETYHQARGNRVLEPDLTLDLPRLRDAVSYLNATANGIAIHRDPKADNLKGQFLVDQENISLGNPAIDLALVLMQYRVPKELWDANLQTYLQVRDGPEAAPQELTLLRESLDHAAYYVGVKEVCGSSNHRLTSSTRRNNQLFAAYL